MAARVFCTVLALSATGGGLWLLLRLFRPLTGRLCSAGWQAGAYTAVLAAFLLPLGLAAGPLLAGLERSAPAAALPAPGAGGGLPLAQVGAALGTLPGAGCLELLAPIWLAGVLLLGTAALLRQRRFRRALEGTARPAEDPEALELLERCRGELSVRRPVALRVSGGVSTPLGVGLLRRAVYLPETPLTGRELELVLRHELCHIARRDLWRKWAALCAALVHWFNPLAWACLGELGSLCEAACDERVVRGMGPPERRFYGETILNVLSRAAPGRGGVCSALCRGTAGMELRLARILRPGGGGRAQRACTALAALALAALLPGVFALQAGAARAEGGALAAFQSVLAGRNRRYEPFGISYDAAADVFYYEGERVSLLLDERPMDPEERARYPWAGRAWELCFQDGTVTDGPALRTVRDEAGALAGVELLPEGEAADIRAAGYEPVTYDAFMVQQGTLYADDPPLDRLPREIGAWAEAREGPAARSAGADGREGWLCVPGGHWPWRAELEDGVLTLALYRAEGCGGSGPTVVRYAALEDVTGFRFYLDGEPLDMEQEEWK